MADGEALRQLNPRIILVTITRFGLDGRVTRRPPLRGEHTAEVLRAAGLDEAQLTQLSRAAVITLAAR